MASRRLVAAGILSALLLPGRSSADGLPRAARDVIIVTLDGAARDRCGNVGIDAGMRADPGRMGAARRAWSVGPAADRGPGPPPDALRPTPRRSVGPRA